MVDEGDSPAILQRPDGASIAYHRINEDIAQEPGIIFLGGFHSDMTGTKAQALDEYCRRVGRRYVRFDYFGHGASSGAFEDGAIGRWRDDAVAVLDELTEGRQILVGSSMGGWIMLLVALARPERVAGLVGIAAAPDFVENLIWAEMTADQRETVMRDGVLVQPSEYDDGPTVITRKLIEEGRDHLLMNGPIDLKCPVRLLHGMRDADVPWSFSMELAERLTSEDVDVTLVKDGDHRLSEPRNLALLMGTLDQLLIHVG